MREFTKLSWHLLPNVRRVLVMTVMACMFAISAIAQTTQTVTGTVFDENNNPMGGVVVQVDGTAKGAITDMNGAYSIKNVSSDENLLFTFVGYVNAVVPADKPQIDVTMEIDALGVEEVVVVGFGTQKKVNLTGSVSVVDEEVFTARPVTSATQALEGAIPGLSISSTSGGLGDASSISIRGQGTIAEGSSGDPLILIDGMEGDINTINPQDIASVSVLKDAAASSIYGSRAPFGVILITTKKGSTGKMKINYNNSFRFATQASPTEMMNSIEQANYMNDMYVNSNSTSFVTDEYYNRVVAYANDPENNATTTANGAVWNNQIQATNANEDWYSNIYKDWTFGQEHNLSINGGTEIAQVYASANYLKQNGYSNYNTDSYSRIATNLRVSGKLTEFLKYNYNVKYQETHQEEPGYLDNIILKSQYMSSLMPMYDPNGNIMMNYANLLQNGGTDINKYSKLYQQFQLVATPLKNWNITGEINYKFQSTRLHTDKQYIYTYAVDGTAVLESNYNTSSVYEKSAVTSFLNPNVFTDYSFTLKDNHNFKVMLGFQSENNTLNSFNTTRDGLIIAGNQTLDMTDGTTATGAASTPSVAGSITDWATVGYFGRLNYDYDGKYLLEVNARYDGTSRFRSDARWDVFPSFSVGWNIANEEFFGDLRDKISTLKLRASYGELGNQNTSSLYPTYSEMSLSSGSSYWIANGSYLNQATSADLVNSSLTWETIKTTNIGFDVTALRNRLSFSFDWFDRKTLNMVGPAVDLPYTLGTDVPDANNTNLTNRGWELSVRWNDRTDSGIGYSASINLYDSQTIIDSYPNDTGSLSFSSTKGVYSNDGMSDTYYSGQKLGEIWGYTTIGIAQTDAEMQQHLSTLPNGGQTSIPGGGDADLWAAGDIMYADINGDGKITSGSGTIYDSGDMSIIGNSTARYNFGVSLAADYKGFDISAFFQGTMKRDYATNSAYFFGNSGPGMWQAVYMTSALDYYRADEDHPLGQNLDSYFPRPFQGVYKNTQIQTRYLLDASYIRLKNMQVGYTFSNEMLSKISLSNLRVFASAENLWTGTSLPDHLDPETLIPGSNYGCNYPLQTTVSFGINVSF
ncbi:MAG: TonB-dependent receptor [Rikenellaceae bacterium]